jgi:hypothetical protein
MSFVSSRRTYDTDSIVLRRIFAYDISNNTPFSTGFILTSLTKGVATFLSPTLALSTIGVPNLPAQLSTIQGELVSTAIAFSPSVLSSPNAFLPSTVAGLGTAGYVSTTWLTSTITGLGTLGYLSSSVIGDVVRSTVEGLGTAGYVSTASFYSTFNTAFPSTVAGLGTANYISSSQLVSTVQGLGNLYVSTASFFSTFDSALPSTVAGLGTAGYVSSIVNNIRSTYTNAYVGNWCNAGFLYSNLGPFSTVQTFQFDMGASVRNQMLVSSTNLDIEVKANLQFGYYDSRSIQYDFSTCLVRGVSLNTSSIIAQENLSYYILNASAVNLPFFFNEKYRFLIKDQNIISTLKSDTSFSTMSVFHRIGISSPTTNQLFVYPALPTSITVVMDNSTRTA